MITNENGQELATINNDLAEVSFPTVDISTFNMEDLENAEVMNIELTSLYWTPEKIGEAYRVIFLGIEMVPMLPIGNEDKSQLNEDGMVILPCASFLVRGEERDVKIMNASKRLVSTLQANGKFIKPGVGLFITYEGKVKNKNNAFQSDSWSVKPLNIKTIPIAEKVKDEVKANANANGDEIGFKEDEIVNNNGNGESQAQPNVSQVEPATNVVPAEEKKKRF